MSTSLKLLQPITSINGFKIGDKVRLKDGDGRPHIIKSFSIDGLKAYFFEVHFEDGTRTMLDNISLLPSDLDEFEYIDLGLPSGTKWASCNVGAKSPEEFGDYLTHDEAMALKDIKIPTKEQCDELIEECKWVWKEQNGVKGRLVTGKNGNSIFLPAAGYRYDTDLGDVGSYGYYWSSSLSTGYPGYAYGLSFYSSGVDWGSDYRYDGQSVRPVTE